MNLNSLREERKKWLGWKNTAPIYEKILNLEEPKIGKIEIEDIVSIELEKSYQKRNYNNILEIAKSLKPWRKGPFRVGELFIDSEWKSFIKFNLLKPHLDIEGKVVGDIGCNNGYYLFRMLPFKPKELIGFDPSATFYLQFLFLDKFIKSGIKYELLGVEHTQYYEKRFDTLFCLGVLYHRSDPVGSLKSLYRALNRGGELFLDTFMIDGDDEVALFPKERYSKIPNIYFIPTIPTLKNWCYRAGFKSVEVISLKKTNLDEQRKTEWIESQSLEEFLDPNNSDLTIEGYPAPKRVYIKATK
jgi:tRNA (mo5U34)-methyltransferase